VNAREWLERGAMGGGGRADLAVLGAPGGPSHAQLTPAALRTALARFSTHDAEHGVDLERLAVRDLGDLPGEEGGGPLAAQARLEAAASEAAAGAAVVAVIGGDSSLTRPALCGIAGGELATRWGLLTFRTHHDMCPPADGPRGTPVRELVERGLPGARVAQVGMHGFAASAEHARWVREQGVHVRRAAEVRSVGMPRLLDEVLALLERHGARRLYADIDLDVLDRAFAPACPASMPGGLAPHHLQEAARLLGADPRVVAVDLTEVDAGADVADTTVRCMASIFLAFCGGLVQRSRGLAAVL
jgi:formiminoglutamase